MVNDHSDSERGNPLPPHRLLFPINSKGSFICTIPRIRLTAHQWDAMLYPQACLIVNCCARLTLPVKTKPQKTKRCYLFHNSLFQQAVLLGRHDEVVRLVLVVHDVLQPDARLVLQVEEELLVEYEGHSTDLLNVGLGGRVAVDEVGSNPNGNLSPELLSRKAFYKRKNILCNINNLNSAGRNP